MKKKVLIITYYWPPSGGPGVQRILKFAKYLPQFGWEPVILTVKDGEYPETDDSLQKDINPDLKIYRVPTFEVFNLFKILSGKKKSGKIATYELIKDKKDLSFMGRLAQFVRMNIFIPDARVGWVLTGVKAGVKIAKKEKPDLILSSSPPHSLQLIAYRLSRKLQLPWIADFRDPWTKAFYDKGSRRTNFSENLNQRLENKIVGNADAIIAVSDGVLQLLPTKESTPTKVIPNGFDRDDFKILKSRKEKFQITYTGYMASTQNPENLWKAISDLNPKYQNVIEIHLYGHIDTSVRQSIHNAGIDNLVTFHPYISHDKVVRVMQDSDLLLLLIPRYFDKGILTGKLFEYLATSNYILGIGNPEGEAADILRKCQAGDMTSYENDPTDLIVNQIQLWQKNIQNKPSIEMISQYDRKNLTKDLAQVFDKLLIEKKVLHSNG